MSGTGESGKEIVKYGSFTPEAAEAEQKEQDRASGGGYKKPKVGKNRWRILPPANPASTSPFELVWEHFVEIGEKKRSFACPRKMASKRCPVCEMVDELVRSKRPIDQARAKRAMPQLRVYFNVIDRDDVDAEGANLGPQTAVVPKGIHKDLLSIARGDYEDDDEADDAEEGERAKGAFQNLCDPTDKGFDVIIVRTGTKRDDTRYKVIPSKKHKPLGNMEWIGAQNDLSALGVPKSADEISRILADMRGGDAEEEELSDDEPEAPARGAAPAAGAPARPPSGKAGSVVDTTAVSDDDEDLPF